MQTVQCRESRQGVQVTGIAVLVEDMARRRYRTRLCDRWWMVDCETDCGFAELMCLHGLRLVILGCVAEAF